MIRQPEFVTKEVAQMTLEKVTKKNPHPFLEQVYFQTSEESLNIQMLHIGPYDDEPKSFAKMDEFAQENNLLRIEKEHREIYLSDARKVAPEKLKTVLRYKVQPK